MPEKDFQKTIMSGMVSVMPVIIISSIGTHDCMQQSLYALFFKVAYMIVSFICKKTDYYVEDGHCYVRPPTNT